MTFNGIIPMHQSFFNGLNNSCCCESLGQTSQWNNVFILDFFSGFMILDTCSVVEGVIFGSNAKLKGRIYLPSSMVHDIFERIFVLSSGHIV
jgi:hypothetical protein